MYALVFRQAAIVCFPNREALEALQEIPSYQTVEVPRPQEETREPQPAAEEELPHRGEEGEREEEGEEEEREEEEREETNAQEQREEDANHTEQGMESRAVKATENVVRTPRETVPEKAAPALEPPPSHAVAVDAPVVGGGKRKPLPSNDVFYLFADENVAVPTWCVFLLAYSVLAVFGVC
ncbi:putative transmembrane protein [Toxoplasma gondii RUB]|uniref:Putative transmembrane protein n=1 Tax=Toxoplasma gondii RUB TaxID=935652 RepID=A0A086LKS1_TOXGO|nr:putative transmembrane protein [Toxoplasma gondii RUB]